MSIIVQFSPTALTTAQYNTTIQMLQAAGDFPAAGLESHVCFGAEGNLQVSEIWASQGQFDAFGERLMPILAENGIEMSAPSAIFDVHNAITT